MKRKLFLLNLILLLFVHCFKYLFLKYLISLLNNLSYLYIILHIHLCYISLLLMFIKYHSGVNHKQFFCVSHNFLWRIFLLLPVICLDKKWVSINFQYFGNPLSDWSAKCFHAVVYAVCETFLRKSFLAELRIEKNILQ